MGGVVCHKKHEKIRARGGAKQEIKENSEKMRKKGGIKEGEQWEIRTI